MKVLKAILLIILLFNSSLLSDSMGRETRAVWVTTNFALDWPPKTTDEAVQKESLRKIFEDLSKKNFNTVYFQVRSNGTVFYNSDIEPYSPYLTGETGAKPNYDPLQYAIELGREFNLEVHAWVNMMRCFSGSDERFLKHPNHIRNAHPDWTVRVMQEGRLSYWLNPGYFRVQDYLVDLLSEISGKYDIDGIHLDFFRYPDKNFEDDKYFESYGFNVGLAEWRRNNLTTILRKFKERVKPRNPYLKVGATPIGIRKNLEGAVGWEGYSSVFQDTERWLKEELVDYLTPQIYWNLNDNPRFDILAKDWVDKSYNRNIILGLAAYKSDVNSELQDMIKFSREINAAGVSFFRYENISDDKYNFFNGLAFPSNMIWKQDKNYIQENIPASYLILDEDEVMIRWNYASLNRDNLRRGFALLNGEKPIKILSLNKDRLRLKFGKPSSLMYQYRICELDRLWNYSALSEEQSIVVPYLGKLKLSAFQSRSPVLINQMDKFAVLAITSTHEQPATIDILNIENIGNQLFITLKTGLNLIPIEENIKILKKLKITYLDSGKSEELNLL